MFFRAFRRSRSRLRNSILVRLLVIAVVLFFVLDSLNLAFPGRHARRVSPATDPTSHGRIFIASIHWNNEAILRSHWTKAVLDLVKHFGSSNVFVAVLEGGSWDRTKDALRDLDTQLAKMDVPRSIVLEDTTHGDEVSRSPSSNETGWVWTPRGRKELRRIPYLANLRNRVMAEMLKWSEATTTRFDKVLWLNDVVFTTEDVLTLFDTNRGQYAAACSLDYSKPPAYYDTFALRDMSGAKTVSLSWPYFFSGTSRHALVSNNDVPVRSCWNGMVAMNAEPFYAPHSLSFRGLSDTLGELRLEGSECCLIHADNPLSQVKGVYVNPHVRVGYSPAAYKAVNPVSPWPSATQRIKGLWKARLVSVPAILRSASEQLVIRRRLSQSKEDEPGSFCVINEMQVLVENGWKHL